MNPSTPSVETILAQAVEIAAPAERQAFVEQACGGDAVLQRQVEQLIANYFQAGSFLERPAGAIDRDGTAGWETAGSAGGVGTVIGPYKLLEQIGEGGMGLVFVAEQQRPVKRRVALKVIKPGMDSRQVVARFEAERQALALMDHAHIAKVYDGGATPEGRLYFVMELVKGTPITDYCDAHRLSTRQRLALFLDLCQAVQHAHQKGIIHRDLKPSNVLISVHDVTPVVKVIDFGVAKAIGGRLTDKTVYTQFTQLIGTPLYMSPEQAGLSDIDVDTRSDVYSLGVLLYELLTGTTPFESEMLKKAGYDEMRRIIREDEPPRPSTRLSTMEQAALSTIAERRGLEPRRLSQQLRGELDWIVMKALEKDRGRRYESASALAADVQRYLNDEPVQACPPSKLYLLRKLVRRHKAGLGVAAGLLLAVLLGVSSLLWWLQERTEGEREARLVLGEAGKLLEAERWFEALSAARRAEAILAVAGGDTSLRQQVQVLIEDLEMARVLQEAQVGMTSVKDGHFDLEGGVVAYAEAFRDYGLDVDGLDPHAAAELIQSRPIHRRLVAALDDWAIILLKLEAEGWRQRLGVARAADPDLWRNRLRDWLEGKDPKAVEELLAADVAKEWPAQTLKLLSQMLYKELPRRLAYPTPSTERIAVLLMRAQQRHPSDFWINQSLVWILQKSRPRRLEDEIRFASVAVALQPQSPGTHVNLGIALYEKGLLDEAIAEYQEAIRIKEDYAEAHNNLGVALAEKGRLDQAITEYQEAIRIKGGYAEAHNNLGNALAEKGRLDQAITEFHEAIHLNKDSAEVHNNLGAALRNKGRLDEAIAEFREAIRIKEDYAEAHNNLGVALRDKGQLDEAIDKFRAAICIKTDYFQAHTNLGTALRDKGRLDEAIAEYKEAIRINKHYGDAHNNLGVALADKGRLDEAIAEFREAIPLKKDDAQAHYNLGSVLHRQGRLDEAVAEFRAAIRLKKDDAEAHSNLGTALRDKGHREEAMAEWREAIRLNKDHAKAHANLGAALKNEGRLDEAIAEYKEAIRIQKDFALAHYNLGNALRDKGRLDEAIAEYKEAIRLKKDYAKAHANLGIALATKGQLDKASAEYREAIRLNKNDAGAHYNLGTTLAHEGRLDEAIAEYREAIRIEKDHPDLHCNLGLALHRKGRLDAAIAEYKEAIHLKKDYAEAHCNLGQLLLVQGQLQEAVEELRLGHQFGSHNPRWPYPSAQWVQNAERLLALDRKLPAVLEGKEKPASVAERLTFAQLCRIHRKHHAAVRFYDEAFDLQTNRTDDRQSLHAYNAAGSAALAGCGEGKDAPSEEPQRARLRRRALEWLRADLKTEAELLKNPVPGQAEAARKRLEYWLVAPDFKGVRGAEGLGKLPEAERHPWQQLWADVADTLVKNQGNVTSKKKSDAK
jgi:tetratricopeptide (TPR) repeat protein/tRNA A-37 threonylcarbamoyl transferase component Bud32